MGVIFIFWCPNITGTCTSRKYVHIQKEDKDKSSEFCECCGAKLKLMGEKTYGGVPRFKNLNTAEKRQMLKKRSMNHNKKSGVSDFRNSVDKKFKNEIRDKFGISSKKLK